MSQANYDLNQSIEAPYINSRGAQPKVSILRKQCVNGQIERAAGLKRRGLEAVDVHMSDLLKGRVN